MKSLPRALPLLAGLALAAALGALSLLGADSTSPNYAALKGQMQVLEAVIDKTMEQTFERPFGLLERTKGAYLPGYGVVFPLTVNLYPARMPSPFDPRPLSQEEIQRAQRIKRERIEVIKRQVPRLLADHAASLRELGAEDSVAVIVHLFHFQAEGENLPTQIVLQVRKADLEANRQNQISFPELVARMKVLAL